MAKYNRPNGKLFGSSATNIGVFGSGQQNETPTTSTDPNTINTLGTHWEDGWNGAVVSQAPYTAPYVEDMNAVNYVNSYNSAYLLQRGIAEYSATEEYQKDSLCTYNGEIWMCKLDNTVGQTPAEGTYWHLQGEVPIMNDNEILVGAVGGTPTVVDTNGQGDVLASASGLNIKSNTIINADINSSAAIDESKLNLDYSTSGLNSTLGGHISDTANPHSVTKAQVLSGDLIVNADVDASAAIEESKLDLDYATDTLNTNIGNVSTALGNHTGDTNNPHGTGISNLDDVVLSTPVQDGDVISFDIGSGKYINRQPAGGALSTLSDTTITSPIANKSLVQYNLNDTKWENSTEVWDTIEVNEIANINTATTDITLTVSDKRHQIFTATDGFTITMPSTGVKAGDKYKISWANSFWSSYTTPFIIQIGSDKIYVYHQFTDYTFIAKVDNPATQGNWYIIRDTYPQIFSGNTNKSLSIPVGYSEGDTGLICSCPKGIYQINYHMGLYFANINYNNAVGGYLKVTKSDGTSPSSVGLRGGDDLTNYYNFNMPLSTGTVNTCVVNKSGIASIFRSNYNGLYKFYGHYLLSSGASQTRTVYFSTEMCLLAPVESY